MSQDERTLIIPFPCPTQNVNRGYLVEVPKTKPTTIRFTEEDRWKIDAVAASLKMSFGEFVRWCAYYAAIEVGNEQLRKSFADDKPKVVDTSDYK